MEHRKLDVAAVQKFLSDGLRGNDFAGLAVLIAPQRYGRRVEQNGIAGDRTAWSVAIGFADPQFGVIDADHALYYSVFIPFHRHQCCFRALPVSSAPVRLSRLCPADWPIP